VSVNHHEKGKLRQKNGGVDEQKSFKPNSCPGDARVLIFTQRTLKIDKHFIINSAIACWSQQLSKSEGLSHKKYSPSLQKSHPVSIHLDYVANLALCTTDIRFLIQALSLWCLELTIFSLEAHLLVEFCLGNDFEQKCIFTKLCSLDADIIIWIFRGCKYFLCVWRIILAILSFRLCIFRKFANHIIAFMRSPSAWALWRQFVSIRTGAFPKKKSHLNHSIVYL